jgi:hypothetical protein
MAAQFQMIFELCDFILRASTRASLISETLQTLQRYVTWIPDKYLFQTELLPVLCAFLVTPFRVEALQVPPGQYLLVVRRIGYAPTSGIIDVPASDTLRLAYALNRSTMLLDTIRTFERRISTRMAEFEQRRAQGVGQFVTREEIERRGSLQVYDFLRNMRAIDVSRITDQMFGGMVALSRREGGSVLGEGAGACPMQVFLDGIVLPRFFNLELLPPPKQIAGIEVYSGASSIPPQFGGPDRRCGVVAVWTRDGH